MRRSPQLLVVLLASGAFVRCECEEVQEFLPAATYEPNAVLDFGVVSVQAERRLAVKVVSNGSAALNVSSAVITPSEKDGSQVASGPFRVALEEGLDALRPGRSSTITVTYRPCPDAWEGGWSGNTLKDGFDLTTCPANAEQVELAVVDNTRLGGVTIQVSGRPGLPPQLEIVCAPGAGHCGESPDLSSAVGCVALAFGEVTAGEAPCDLTLEIRNRKRQGRETGELSIERIDMLVFDNEDPSQTLVPATGVGFSLRTEAGEPLVIDSDHPLTIPIESGKDFGKVRVKVRYDGSKPGNFTGARPAGGLRVYSNDPDPDKQPVVSVLLSASGTAPDLEVLHPRRIDFRNVPQGRTATATLGVRNNGNATLRIEDIRLKNTTGIFEVSTSRGAPPFDVLDSGAQVQFDLIVRYRPSGGGIDADAVVIVSNDPDEPEAEVPVSGGAVPEIRVDPSPTLVFPLENPPPPPPIPPRKAKLTIANVGFGDLIVQQLSIVGPAPDEDPNHSSVDDFTITGCTTNPCPQSLTLCAPGSPSCQSSSAELEITYANNDASQTDLVSLRIASNDPVNPIWTVVLSAEDSPCLFPTPVIQVLTMPAVAGQNVEVSGAGSHPGSGTRITRFEWSWRFTQGTPPLIEAVTPGDDSVVHFTPAQAGLHILALRVVNDCGATSQALEAERINVVPAN